MLTHEIPAHDRQAAAARSFRARVWGGGVVGAEEIAAMLERSGFGSIQGDYPVGSFRATCARNPVPEPVEPASTTRHWDTAAP